MNFLTCIIVDDDHFATEQLREYISKIPFLKLIDSFNDPAVALEEISCKHASVDFLFIDVEMPKMNGIELSGHLTYRYKYLILVSSHLKYAADGYGANAKEFLTKPFDFRKFNNVVNSLMEKFALETPYIMVKLGLKNELIKIYTQDIIRIEGASNYVKIHTKKGIYMPYYKLSTIEEHLQENPNFIRINKSNIISAQHIKEVKGFKLILDDNQVVTVSSLRKLRFNWFVENIIRKKYLT